METSRTCRYEDVIIRKTTRATKIKGLDEYQVFILQSFTKKDAEKLQDKIRELEI